MNFSLIIKRYSKILNWKHDTYYASLMNKYTYFDEFMRFCNDNKGINTIYDIYIYIFYYKYNYDPFYILYCSSYDILYII